MNCEPHEVNLATLPTRACFELVLSRQTAIRGVVLQHLRGSTLVTTGSKREHWSSEAPVVPFLEEDPERWLIQIEKENVQMKTNGKKKDRKPKAEKTRSVIRFTLGKKEPLPKYLDEKNTAYSALMYRAIKESEQPVTFAEVFDKIKRSVANKTEGKTPKNTLSVILQKMVKEGRVARSETKEEEEAKAVAT